MIYFFAFIAAVTLSTAAAQVNVSTIEIFDANGNACLKADLYMKILIRRGLFHPHGQMFQIPVETSNYSGICTGTMWQAGQAIDGPAVAFTWTAISGDDQDSVVILWKEDADLVFIDQVQINVTSPYGGNKITEKMTSLQLFPSAIGKPVNFDLQEIEMNSTGEFIFCRGEYTLEGTSSEEALMYGLAVGVAVTMVIGIVIYCKGARKKASFGHENVTSKYPSDL